LRLDLLPPGVRVFIDSSIFIYHFSGASQDCRGLLERCEAGEVKGATSVVVLAEVAHRLMLLEALSSGLLRPPNAVNKLRRRPELVRRLRLYQDRVEQIPLMGVEVLPAGLATLERSADVRRRHGLLVNDSLVVAAAEAAQIGALASADSDFRRVKELKLYEPADL
jgi:predicted nucleic acid-binding protein